MNGQTYNKCIIIHFWKNLALKKENQKYENYIVISLQEVENNELWMSKTAIIWTNGFIAEAFKNI